MEKEKILRTLDANLNRAVEGLRVAEDGLRFVNGDAKLTARLRELRHEFRKTAAMLPGGGPALLSARDSAGDVARNAAPRPRTSARQLILTNFKRAQEAARSLEEFSKLLSPRAASRFGELRFRLYDIEKEISASGRARPAMPKAPFLYAVAGYETLRSGGSFAFLKSIVAAGCAVVQLREKDVEDKVFLEMACKVAEKMKDSGALFFVNDRVDIALAAGAGGVHLGTDDLPIEAARNIAGEKLLFGTSTHSMKQAMDAAAQSPDYIALGPIFASPTKTERKPVGAALLRRVCAAVEIPVVAIGGIEASNAGEVAAAGAAGAAVVSALSRAKNPGAAAAIIIKEMRRN